MVFNGDLYLLVGPNTFSSANMFAAVIQDNRIGAIIGEPTGNQPTCYGEPLSFTMPVTGIRFRISHKQFFRPDVRRDDEDCIYPDFEVYREIEDVISGRDAQMEMLIGIIKAGKND
jgi:C-terminal processing protease CtpA/Prc